MKRVIAAIILIVCISLPALSEIQIDQKSIITMNDSDILRYWKLFNNEAIARGLIAGRVETEEPFYAGVYYVGENIKPGNYAIYTKEFSNLEGYIYDSKESYINKEEPIEKLWNSANPARIFAKLDDGMVFVLKVVGNAPYISVNKPSWMP